MPITFVACVLSALAISGIPPLNGFVSKWMVYQGIIEMGRGGGYLWVLWLVAAMFGSALTLASFMKVLHAVFLGIRVKKAGDAPKEAGLLMAIPMLVIALLVKWKGGKGPVLFKQVRCSLGGGNFTMLKFRTMAEDAEADGPGWTVRDDPRVTRMGRLLRKTSLDELPQLFNVLLRQMSLVGPRPWPVAMFREQVGRGVEYRKFIRAGWTGPAQLQKGHPNPLGSEKLDMQYLERCHTWNGWKLWQYDLGILYRTIRIMLEGQGLKY